MARGDLVVDIIARDRASQAFDKVAGSAGKTSRTIKAGATIAAVGFAAVAAGAFKLAQGAADDQKAATALATQLKNTTGATDKQVASVEDWISAQGKLTGITDDQLRPALAQLATATGSIGKAQKLAALAMNVSAGSGKSLEAVTKSLSRAYATGSATGLAKFGIQVTKNKKDTLALASAQLSAKTAQKAYDDAVKKHGKSSSEASVAAEKLRIAQGRLAVAQDKTKKSTLSVRDATALLADKFKGQASAQADTLSGKMAIFKTQLSEAGESIGYALIPALTSLAGFLNNSVVPAIQATFGWIQSNQTTTKVLAITIASLGAAFIVATGAIKAYNAIATVVRVATIVWTNAQWALNIAMSSNPIGLVVIAIAALVAAFVIAYKKSDTFRAIVQGAFRAVLAAASAVLGWLKSHWPLLLAILTGPIGLAAVAIAKNWDKIKAGARAVGSGFKAIWDGVTKWLGKAWDYISDLPGKISGAFSGIWSGLAGGLKSAINSVLHLPLTIPRVNTHIPGVGTVGGQTLIPALAKGGVTTGPTLALIGDNPGGRELVKPLGPDGSVLSPREMQMLARLIGAEIVSALNGAARTARTA